METQFSGCDPLLNLPPESSTALYPLHFWPWMWPQLLLWQELCQEDASLSQKSKSSSSSSNNNNYNKHSLTLIATASEMTCLPWGGHSAAKMGVKAENSLSPPKPP